MLVVNYNNTPVPLESMEYSKTDGYVTAYSSSNQFKVSVAFPFKVENIKDYLFNSEEDIERIIILRNNLFGERNLVDVKTLVDGEYKSVGFIFTLRTILDDEGIHIEDEKLKNYFVRTIVSLLAQKTEFISEKPEFVDSYSFELYDFFPEDSIICAISKQQLKNYNEEIEISLFYYLGLYGFTPIYSNNESSGELSLMHKNAFSLIMNGGKGIIKFKQISQDLTKELFIKKFIKTHGKESNKMTKFLLVYQVFEILIDKVLKIELQNKISNINSKDTTGHKLRSDVQEISSESFRISKLINFYCTFHYSSDYETSFLIEVLFDKYFENKKKSDYGAYFYEFRNQVVHNLRAFYHGDEQEVDDKLEIFSEIVSHAEFLSIESVISFDPDKK